MKVVHFQRKPGLGYVSIERLFFEIRSALPSEVDCSCHVCPALSQGVFPRVRNIFDAARHQGQVNHITGDVHYLAIGMHKQRTILTVHDCISLERLRGVKRAILRWFWYILPVQRSALVTVVSESTRNQLLRYVRCDTKKIRVIHNCVGKEFSPMLKPFDADDPLILLVGTGANKNLDRVIPALSRFRCRLNIVGKLSDVQEAKLRLHGFRFTNSPNATDAEMLRAYQESDLLMFVSTYEGFGLPIVEANAVGRPVITSNVYSMPEIAGNAACLVDPLDVESIRSGVIRVLHDDAYRASLITAGFENVKRFSPRNIAGQYSSLYRELAN